MPDTTETTQTTETIEQGAIAGNLTKDPELRYTQAGRPVASLRVAVSERYRGSDGRWQDTPTEYVTVTVWGQLAENCCETLVKGDRIAATGVWQERTWTGRDGQDRTDMELSASDCGPSLKWAAARLARTERRQADTGDTGTRPPSRVPAGSRR